jgi:hypothetical protein
MPKAIPYNQALPSVLTSAVSPGFQVRINQMVRLFIQLTQASPSFANEAAVKVKANWDTLIAAVDATKIQYTALFSASKVNASKALEVSGDTNATYRGIPEYFGEGFTRVEATFRGKDGASMNSMANYTQFSLQNSAGLTKLQAYWCNNDGHFLLNSDFSGIPMYNFALRTRSSDGLNSNDIIGFTFDLEPNWDANLIPVVPSFDPRLYV